MRLSKEDKLRDLIMESIRELRDYKKSCTYSFGEIGYYLFVLVHSCIEDVDREEFESEI